MLPYFHGRPAAESSYRLYQLYQLNNIISADDAFEISIVADISTQARVIVTSGNVLAQDCS